MLQEGNEVEYKHQPWLEGNEVEYKHPPWLTSLQESDLLSRAQCDFIASVCSFIGHEANTISQTSESRIREIRQTALCMKKDFEMVVEKLQTNFHSKEIFQKKYPEWRSFRDMSIRHLRKIANSIDEDRENCQVAKSIGSLVSLIGGGICLATEGDRDNRTSQMIGSALMGLGTLTSTGTSAFEEILLQENVDKAKGIMELDRQSIKQLVEWLDEASSLKRAMDKIQSISCSGIDFVEVAESFQNVSKQNLSAKQMKREFQTIVKSLNLPSGLEEISDVIGILISASMLFKRYFSLFKAALQGSQVKLRLRLSVDLCRAAYIGGNSVATFTQSGGRMTSDQKSRVVKGMALDAMNILLVNLQDPKSVEGREIRKVADELEREADQFRSLYARIRSLNLENL